MDARALAPALVLPFIAWRVYARVRRNIGEQPLRPTQLVVRAVIFGVITAVLALLAWRNGAALAGLAGGLAAGVPLAWLGLRLTRFETNERGHFYTPNTYIGVALSLLLVARLAYRFVQLFAAAKAFGAPPPGTLWSPLTLGVFGLLAGYYVAYSIGVVVRGREHVAKAR